MHPKVTLTLRIWFNLMLSQVAVLGIVVMIVWNYNPKFYIILQVYSLYSQFCCVHSILNTTHEHILALIILVLSHSACQFLNLVFN